MLSVVPPRQASTRDAERQAILRRGTFCSDETTSSTSVASLKPKSGCDYKNVKFGHVGRQKKVVAGKQFVSACKGKKNTLFSSAWVTFFFQASLGCVGL